jgi:hypothetical protein
MALPTQEDFLANALEPVEPVEHENCSICHDPMKTPVRLPCKHDFCKECITEWLTQPRVDSCPMCRRRLFQSALPLAPIQQVNPFAHFQPAVHFVPFAPRALWDADAHAQAMRMAQLLAENQRAADAHTSIYAEMELARERYDYHVGWAFELAGICPEHLRGVYHQTDFRSADALNLNRTIRWTEECLEQLRPHALSMLTNNYLPRLPQGAVQINVASLGSSLVLMSNVLMHLAIKRSRP